VSICACLASTTEASKPGAKPVRVEASLPKQVDYGRSTRIDVKVEGRSKVLRRAQVVLRGSNSRTLASAPVKGPGSVSVAWKPSGIGLDKLRVAVVSGKRTLAVGERASVFIRHKTVTISPGLILKVPQPGMPGDVNLGARVALRVGDIVAAGAGRRAPNGLLAEVRSVRHRPSWTRIGTRPITLLDAVPKGAFDLEKVVAEGTGGYFTLGGEEAESTDGEAHSLRSTISCGSGSELTVRGFVSVFSRIRFSASWHRSSVVSAQYESDLSVDSPLTARTTSSASCSVSKRFGPLHLEPIEFKVGSVPVVLVPRATYDLSAKGSVDGASSTALAGRLQGTAGIDYSNGHFSPAGSFDADFTDLERPTVWGDADLGITASIRLTFLLYGVAGPSTTVKESPRLSASLGDDPWWTLTAPVSADARLDVPSLGLESGAKNVYKRSFALAEGVGTGPDDPDGAGGATVRRISAGENHACGIRTDDTVSCWGDNSGGKSTPPNGAFKAVSAGRSLTCGIRTDDTVSCWGNNYDESHQPSGMFKAITVGGGHACGLLLDDTMSCFYANNHGQSDAPGGTFKAVSAGGDHTCGIRTDDTVSCWGDDTYGQSTPPGGTFKAVSAGSTNTCGIRPDDTLTCWGDNSYGKSIPPSGKFRSISASGGHACAIRTNDKMSCWGDDTYGQSTPPGGAFKAVSAGGQSTCWIRSTDKAGCWGDDTYGQSTPPIGKFKSIGVGGVSTCWSRPDDHVQCWGTDVYGYAMPSPTGTFKLFSAGNSHACGIRPDDTVDCWGSNYDGESTPPSGAFESISAGGGHTCGIRPDDTVSCWGSDHSGESTPPAGKFRSVSAGSPHTCGIRTDDTVSCWGDDTYGQSTPPGGTFKAVSAGTDHTCGIRTDDTVSCWGRDVNVVDEPSGTFKLLSAGRRFTCGIRTDDTVSCWGASYYGEAISPNGTFKSLSAGTAYSPPRPGWEFSSPRISTCGIRADDKVVCWGGLARQPF